MFNNPNPRIQLACQLSRIYDGAKVAIQNQIALVRPERSMIGRLTQGYVCAKRAEKISLRPPAKGDDL